MSSWSGHLKEQGKHYKRRHAKVKRSKSQGYKHDKNEPTDTIKGG